MKHVPNVPKFNEVESPPQKDDQNTSKKQKDLLSNPMIDFDFKNADTSAERNINARTNS